MIKLLLPAACACSLLLGACQSEPRTEASAEPPAAKQAAAEPVLLPSQPEGTHNGEERVGALRIRFDHGKLTKVGANIALPPDWTSNVLGIKLLASDRAPLLERATCSYGASGSEVRCNADQEAGLGFAAVGIPYAQLRAQLPADQIEPVTVAGATGVKWAIGAEGEGAEYVLIPSGGDSLLIVRQYREVGNPDPQAIEDALRNLRLAN